ncbi:ABC transporter G family member 11 [Acorus gramineus]|uniref:ABC transporter G family member 11 n=1 Tax=Acorus gramineus TaxID=55184 RepID=A0AAV9AWG5_ACOGR|nr:ABC transporter G family member 11 [Acorus gramineus]
MDSQIEIPRWTAGGHASPTTDTHSTKAADSMKTGSFASDDSFSVAADRSFPFTTTTQIIPHPPPPHDNYNSDYNNYNDTDGVSLTWEDLWVTASAGGKAKHILHGVTGYARPGEVLAIMGPSGSGKSTLLDALAGRLASNTRKSGEVLINGRKQKLAFGTSAFVTQDDILMTTLTVREAVYYSAHLQLPDTMTSAEKRFRAETTIKEMGIQDAVNTRIGGCVVKGLSGGQKLRVSICMEILTRPKLLFLDEPTSGLNSAASYHVMSRIVGLAEHDGRTVVASIHQPSSEVFELFHNLCLLSYGKTVYFGPRSFTSEFFACNRFPCPSLRNPSDHYLRTVNKDFEDKDMEQGPGAKSISVAESINILVNSYQSSDTFQEVKHKVAEMCKNEGAIVEKGSQASSFTQSLILTKRSFINMYRDLGYYWLRFAIYIALCLCVGTIYYNVGDSYGSIQSRGSMLMFIAAFLTFMAIGGFFSFVEDMKKSFDHFVYFALVLFTCMMLVESLMMIVASVVPDFLMGIITSAGIQGVMMLNGGFFRLPHDLPKPVWRLLFLFIVKIKENLKSSVGVVQPQQAQLIMDQPS